MSGYIPKHGAQLLPDLDEAHFQSILDRLITGHGDVRKKLRHIQSLSFLLNRPGHPFQQLLSNVHIRHSRI